MLRKVEESMIRVTASEFARNFGKYKEAAQREPVEITSYDRPSGYLISAADFEEYRRLKEQRRQVFHITEFPPELIAELESVRMDPRHDHLNALLDDEWDGRS